MPKRPAVESLPQEVKAWLDRALVEGNFSGYELLAEELRGRGYAISKSALHRYGQGFEERLAALKLASEQAKAVVSAAPDEEGAVNEALMRLVQEHLFKLLLSNEGEFDLPKVARAVAELGRATVTQKRWQAEVREKVAAKFREMEAEASGGKRAGFDVETLRRVREEIYGIM